MNTQSFISHSACGQTVQTSFSRPTKLFLASIVGEDFVVTAPSLRRCAPMIDMRQASIPSTSRCTSCVSDNHINDVSDACFAGASCSVSMITGPFDGGNSIGPHKRQQHLANFGRRKPLCDYTVGVHDVACTDHRPKFFCEMAHV